ncbi:MAG: hypothetical protein JXR23_09670 [Pontiellaceae bacterium]|nr:hypothetical protein [Pontiellaceae bacterium]
MKTFGIQFIVVSMLFLAHLDTPAQEPTAFYPKGLIFNMNFDAASNGLVPNKGGFPLFVPLNGLEVKTLINEQMLDLPADQGLTVPHSSILQPDGSMWLAGVRVGVRPSGKTGMVMSQTNDRHGYAIYLLDGAVYAAVCTADSVIILQQSSDSILRDCSKGMVRIDLEIKANEVVLLLDRAKVASAPLTAPLDGGGADMLLRIGNHESLPPFLAEQEIPANGIFGAISLLQLWRQ